MDDCDVTAALERRRSQRVVDRIMRSLSPHALLLVNWFIWHHADHALQELVHFSAELWGWDEELFNIELDRDCWVTFNAVELPDYFEPPIGTRGSQRRPVAAVLGYDAGDGV